MDTTGGLRFIVVPPDRRGDPTIVLTLDQAFIDAYRSAIATSASPPPSAMETGGADITTAELAQPRSPGEGEPPQPVAVKAARPAVATLPVESEPPSRSAPHQSAPHGASTGMPVQHTTPRDASQAPPGGP